MSRTRKVNSAKSNPTTRRFNWKGGKDQGYMVFWNSDEKEEQKVDFNTPFYLLDARSGVTGWSDSEEARIWSNHVENTKSETLTVRAGSKVICEGPYNDIKDKLAGMGGQFAKFIYAAYMNPDSNEYEICCIELKKSGLKSWIDFSDNCEDLYAQGFMFTEAKQGKKGSITFQVPVIGSMSETMDETLIQTCNSLDKMLVEYFDSLVGSSSEAGADDSVENEVEETEKKEILF